MLPGSGDVIIRQGEESLLSFVLWHYFAFDLLRSPFQENCRVPAGAEGGPFINLGGDPHPVPHGALLSALNLPCR